MAGRLTPEQREEGRRLLEATKRFPHSNEGHEVLADWCIQALLADHEEISRAAVREFAEAVLDIWPDESVMRDDSEFMRGSVGAVGITRDAIRKIAAARGVTLEKP